jgi:hypothetical protein
MRRSGRSAPTNSPTTLPRSVVSRNWFARGSKNDNIVRCGLPWSSEIVDGAPGWITARSVAMFSVSTESGISTGVTDATSENVATSTGASGRSAVPYAIIMRW